jgi:small-conductance mechanosensitive channel
MTRTFEDRGARREQRGRSFATPVPVKAPVLATASVVLITLVVTLATGVAASQAFIAAAAVFVVATLLAHRTVTSMLAGVALLVIRPYSEGERVRLAWPVAGGVLEAVIVHLGIANTTLASDAGVLVISNNQLLRNPPTPAP